MLPIHIVGSGLTGATMARLLADQGLPVKVFERRKHVGGNVHDFMHESGMRVHTYGPHYFRTSAPLIWDFVQRFGAFYRHEAVVKSWVEGQFENWPVSGEYLRRKGLWPMSNPKSKELNTPGDTFEAAALRMMPEVVYEKFVKPYTHKQWGIPPDRLDAALAKRFDVHHDDDPRLTPRHRWQGLPEDGYAAWMLKMLEGIEVHLGVDYLEQADALGKASFTVFTGAIDAYFGFDLGRLQYRGQQRVHEFLPKTSWYQPCGQVNNPSLDEGKHIRTLEWKHLMPTATQQQIQGTVITRETPFSPQDTDQCEYPFPDSYNRKLFKQYQKRAQQIPNLLICGRLGEYCYYDMDQAIGRAMVLVNQHILPVLTVNTEPQLINLSYF